MNGPAHDPLFFWIWSGFLLLMIGWVIAAFLWGIRSGQFEDQERARWLPLDLETGTGEKGRRSAGERRTSLNPGCDDRSQMSEGRGPKQ